RAPRREARAPLGFAPHVACGLDHEVQLRNLIAHRHGITTDARGETALRRQRELVERRVTACLFNAALEFVLTLHLRTFGGDEAEHGGLAFGQEAQWRGAAGARRIVFEKITVD